MNRSIPIPMRSIRIFLFLSVNMGFLAWGTVYASDGEVRPISWGILCMGLLGGLALFLLGMEKLSIGMKKAAGKKMRQTLAAVTDNRFIALFTGAFITMVIQSSSATTVMLVSLVQAQLMTFVQAMAIILGADIGTTVTAQLIALKLTDFALMMIALGFVVRMSGKSDRTKYIGEIILGLGFLFYGMKLMSDAMIPLRTHPLLLSLMERLDNPLMGLFIGTVITALIQSSAAFIGILIVMAQQGVIDLNAGIPLILGANIGTCITAALASIGTSREAKRVAIAHVIFKILGVILFIAWVPEFAHVVRKLSGEWGSDIARQIANAHTIFSVGIGIIFLPFINGIARLILFVFPERKEDDLPEMVTHLDESKIVTPSFAINLARSEISRMAEVLERMLAASIHPLLNDAEERDPYRPQKFSLVEGIKWREKKINFLDTMISSYLLKIAKQPVSQEQICEIYQMLSIVKDMESIGDIIERNMLPLIHKKQALTTDFSDEGKEELSIYHKKACKQIRLLKEAFAETSLIIAQKIMAKERKYLDLESQYRIRHLNRMLHERKESVETHTVHVEMMNLMKQIIVYSSNIAKTYMTACQFK